MPEEKDKVIPVRVALRIRPLSSKEVGEGCQQCIKTVSGEPQVVMGEGKAFTYDHVYGAESQQKDLYSQTVVPLLEGFFKGYNATVLAYGQTGSGKTYSMGTAFTMCNENTEDRGVIPRLIKTMFDWIEERQDKTAFLLKASFLEIHNEEIHDLLNPLSSEECKITIRDTQDGGIKIAGLHEIVVTCCADMVQCLEQGSASRATGATAMNSRSSRSHAIYTITMEQKDLQGSELRKAKFHLVDLAGSERVKKTHAQGERFKEGVNINRGLLALGNVISALSDEQRKSNAHVPYRDSKLTRLLQDSLGGNSNTMMIACVSPADSNFEETLNTLRYADRARQIKNKPIVNLDPTAAELARLRQQVQLLQMQLLQGQTITGAAQDETSGECPAINIQELAERVSQLEAENEKLSAELHSSVDQNTQMYEKVLVAELARDKMLRKFQELKSHISSKVDVKEEETNATLVEELHSRLHEFEDSMNSATQLEDVVQNHEQEIGASEPMTNSDTSSIPAADASFVSQHALRQAELGRQLQELTKALTLKEELANKMAINDTRLTSIRKEHEGTVRELEAEISRLEKEKADLSVALNTAKTANADSKQKEKSRNRIKELEAKIQDLKKKQVEQQKLLKLKEQSDNTIKKLNCEIQNMKCNRVKLMRQMKEESERFRALKAQKEKEINHLKDQGRKRQFEYKKLESMHMKQQAVLKRKTEEVSAVQKRLKLALDRQKEAAEKRSAQQHQQQKHADGLMPRMKSWLSHEVEVLVSVGQAKQTLENLIEDRKVLSRQLAELRSRQEELNDEPASKKMLQNGGTVEDNQNKSQNTEQKISTLENELELRSCQIAALQQKLLDAEQGEKTKHRWNNLHTMAEAKAGLQALLQMTVAAKLSNAIVENAKEEAERLNEERRSREQELKTEMSELVQSHDQLITRLNEEHEEKVNFILKQIPVASNAENSKDESSQQQHQLAQLREENENLKEQLKKLMDVFEKDSPTPVSKKEKTKKNNQSIDWDEYLSGESGESDIEDSLKLDPDWAETPYAPRLKRSDLVQICKCKGTCARNICSCRRSSSLCSEKCGCSIIKCINRMKESEAVRSAIETESSTCKNSTGEMERKALVEVKNRPFQGVKPLSVKQKRTEMRVLGRNRPKSIQTLHSSSSVSSSDDDTQSKQPGRIRPGATSLRAFSSYGKLRTPVSAFGSGKKTARRKSIGKFHPENKRKRKLYKGSTAAGVLVVKN